MTNTIALKSDAAPQPMPPRELLQLVGGAGETALSYLTIGYNVAEEIRGALSLVGRDFGEVSNVLDFGCGCARVLRWLADPGFRGALAGADVDHHAIEWCRNAFPGAQFTCNNPRPPLDFPDDTFDLVYGISVFTHLDESFQLIWLEELRRVTKPGGIVMLSVQGDAKALADLGSDERDRYRAAGILFKKIHDDSVLPVFYHLTYHARSYIEANWSRYFTLLAYIEHGPLRFQDLVVLQKNAVVPSAPSAGACHHLDLPCAWIDIPTLGASVDGPVVVVSGGAFRFVGECPPLDVWLDGDRVASCVVGLPYPGAAYAAPDYKNAMNCRFEAAIPVDRIENGRHVISIRAATASVPVAKTYFVSAGSMGASHTS